MTQFIAFCIINSVAFSNGVDCPKVEVLTDCQYVLQSDCFSYDDKGENFVVLDGQLIHWDTK